MHKKSHYNAGGVQTNITSVLEFIIKHTHIYVHNVHTKGHGFIIKCINVCMNAGGGGVQWCTSEKYS